MNDEQAEIERQATKLAVRHTLERMLSPWGEGGLCAIASSTGTNCAEGRFGKIDFEKWCDVCKARFYLERMKT